MHDYAEELSKELQLPDDTADQGPGQLLDGEAGRVSVSLRDMRQGLPTPRHSGQTHEARVRQGAAVQMSLLRSQNQATWKSLSAHTNQSSWQKRVLE